jgi:hypothetical protein
VLSKQVATEKAVVPWGMAHSLQQYASRPDSTTAHSSLRSKHGVIGVKQLGGHELMCTVQVQIDSYTLAGQPSSGRDTNGPGSTQTEPVYDFAWLSPRQAGADDRVDRRAGPLVGHHVQGNPSAQGASRSIEIPLCYPTTSSKESSKSDFQGARI